MGRWQPGARERLEQAALDLFLEQGFTETTVPQITARAGLTTRTFFRHFADKREVLFAGEELVPERVARLMAEAPPSLGPMELITEGLAPTAAEIFEGRGLDYLLRRRAAIDAEPALHERELRKFSLLGPFQHARVLSWTADLLELGAILNLNPDMLHAGRRAALADGEVDPRVFQYPLGIIALAHAGFGAERQRVRPHACGEIANRHMDVKTLHQALLLRGATTAGAQRWPPQQFSVRKPSSACISS